MELRRELPADVEYLPCGTLWVAADEEEMAEVQRKQAVYDGIGVRAEVLDPQATGGSRAESAARPRRAGCWCPTMRWSIRPAPPAICWNARGARRGAAQGERRQR